MWNYHHMGSFGWGWGIGWIFQLIFWAFIIWLVLILINHFSKKSENEKSGKSVKEDEALDILKVRYAKGEISKDEFEKIKEDLS